VLSEVGSFVVVFKVPKGTMKEKQGTLMGVFLPVVASMWGVLVFVRFGVLAGYAGWMLSIVFALISAAVQILSLLSLCAILSNSSAEELENGSTFSLLKVNLGAHLAGIICVLYYIGMTTQASVELLGSIQAISYIIAAERGLGASSLTSSAYVDQIALGAPILFSLVFVRSVDVKYVHAMTATILLAVLTSYIFGFLGLFLTLGDWGLDLDGFTGLTKETFRENAFPDFSLPQNTTSIQIELGVSDEAIRENSVPSAATAMALIFPNFLEIFLGANNAANLKTPLKSIFRGTLAAICLSVTIYFFMFLLLGGVAERDLLKVNLLLFSSNTWPSEWIGLIATILVGLGACVSLLEMAPVVLQAVAQDRLFGLNRLKLHKFSKNGEPVYAVGVSFCINFMLLFVTSAYFELLAEIVTIIFLQAYATMHSALLINEIQMHWSWRPTFSYYSWKTGMAGLIVNFALMFYIEWRITVATIAAAGLALFLVEYFEDPRRKGLANRALGRGRVLRELLNDEWVSHTSDEIPPWEPHVLCIVAEKSTEEDLQLASLTKHLSNIGFLPTLAILTGSRDAEYLFQLISAVDSRAFAHPLVRPHLFRAIGLGTFFRPNLALINLDDERLQEVIDEGFAVAAYHERHREDHFDNVVLEERVKRMSNGKSKGPGKRRRAQIARRLIPPRTGTMDVWWTEHGSNEMNIVIADLLCSHPVWKRCTLRVFSLIEENELSEATILSRGREMLARLKKLRISAVVDIIQVSNGHLLRRTEIKKKDVLRDEIFDRTAKEGDLKVRQGSSRSLIHLFAGAKSFEEEDEEREGLLHSQQIFTHLIPKFSSDADLVIVSFFFEQEHITALKHALKRFLLVHTPPNAMTPQEHVAIF